MNHGTPVREPPACGEPRGDACRWVDLLSAACVGDPVRGKGAVGALVPDSGCHCVLTAPELGPNPPRGERASAEV